MEYATPWHDQLELAKERAFTNFLAAGKTPYTEAIETERKVLCLDKDARADDGRVRSEELMRALEQAGRAEL